MEELQEVAAIAEACVAPEAQDQPTMGEVIESLRMLQVRIIIRKKKKKIRTQKCAAKGDGATRTMLTIHGSEPLQRQSPQVTVLLQLQSQPSQ